MDQYVYPNSSRYTRRQFDAVAAFYAEGLSGVEASERAGMGENTGIRFLRRNGLLRPKAERYGAVKAAFARRRAEKAETAARLAARPASEIAARLGVNPRTVFRHRAHARTLAQAGVPS